jgi:hypothetical protein
MIEITTYLRGADGSFVQAESCDEPPADPDYIEGAVQIGIDGNEILGKREWDYVDQLWAYLATMTKELRETGKTARYLPDQPIEISFERQGNRVLVTSRAGSERRSGSVDEAEFLREIRRAGDAFFAHMTTLDPAETASYTASRSELHR